MPAHPPDCLFRDTVLQLVADMAGLKATTGGLKETTEQGFQNVTDRLDTLNGRVAKHEQVLQEHKLELIKYQAETIRSMADLAHTLATATSQLSRVTTLADSHETFVTANVAAQRARWRRLTLAGSALGIVLGVVLKLPAFFVYLYQWMTQLAR